MSPPAHILVVDDEPDVEALVTQRFRRQVRQGELQFTFAHDGQHALELLESEPEIDVVLSDINMPRMDGLTLLARLNELKRDLRTVIVSAYGDMRNIRTAMNRGAFDFVTKPIEFDDLEATLAKTLDHVRLLRGLEEQKRRAERAHATLSRYFSPKVAEALAREADCLEPRGEWREATFLFTDLAGFTPLVETLESAVIVDLLNAYLAGMTNLVFEHGGTVMKIVGDALHAVFGAPGDDPEHPRHAVECALALDEFAMGFRSAQVAAGVPLGVTRIGVHTGPAMIGNFGGESYFDYTLYGDAVNTAARLERANKAIGTRICLSESVVSRIPDLACRPIGSLLLRGKSSPWRCFEPLAKQSAHCAATQAYQNAFALLEAGDPKARQAFAALVGQYEDDPLSTYHLQRVLAGALNAEIDLARD